MKKLRAIANSRRLTAALCIFALVFATRNSRADQRAIMTAHVPEAVSSGRAPLVGHLLSSQRLSLAISLPLRNEGDLDDLLQQVYDPQGPRYHQYLSVPEFTSRFGPAAADYDAVLRFAEAHGLAVID